ncbi:MAG: hypothetical protein U9Q85_02495 [Patescibacteria group bacterium]|nr:hypothetical protein [Patescibacteria group bacterium]
MNKTQGQWPIVGNEHIVEYLSRCLSKNKIEQTYIFEGPKDLGKNTVLKYFIQCLLCVDNEINKSVPCEQCLSCRAFIAGRPDTKTEKEQSIIMSDLHSLEKPIDKKNISIDQVRSFIGKLGLSSFGGKYKIGIINDAETLSTSAANALLKTLEEPKKDVIIFLLTRNSKFLLPTIVSRSQVLRFRAVASDLIYDYLHKVHGARRSQAKQVSRLSVGRPALALKFYKDKEFLEEYRAQSNLVFDFFKANINERLAISGKLIDQKLRGQEAGSMLGRILDIYESVHRDLILACNNSKGRQRHTEQEETFSTIIARLREERIKQFSLSLQKARQYLRANIKAQTVLEYLAISI